MKRLLATVALGALLIGSTSMVAEAHGQAFHDHGGFHGPARGPGRGPGGGWGHGPGRWHGPDHGWGRGWDRNHFHGPWFWYGGSVLWWDGGVYVTVVPIWDPVTGMYYFVNAGGVRIWLR